MEGVSASRVAIDIMTDLALGRGTQIPKDVGLIDDRFHANDRVTVVRPLREFSNKEIVVYVRCVHYLQSFMGEAEYVHTHTHTHVYTDRQIH